MKVQHFYDNDTHTLTYVVFDPDSKDAIVIDPVLDYDPALDRYDDTSAQLVLEFIKSNHLTLHYILETHVHADHLTASQMFKLDFPKAKVGASVRVTSVQSYFKNVLKYPDLKADGSDFDFLFEDNKQFSAGSLQVLPLPTPGHTSACTSFLINGHLFTGDTLFMPDYGTGRCDFPNGSATNLYHSITSLYRLPEETVVYVGHGQESKNGKMTFQTTIGESKKSNILLSEKTTLQEFVTMREKRDKTLKEPRLLQQSLQVNLFAGYLPDKDNLEQESLIRMTRKFQNKAKHD